MYENKSGVNDINKQRFLAELSKLLTFMYEEDRQEALAVYSRMFEEAVDEQKLLQILVSPTRQAVIVARAYDAKERKLQVQAQSRKDRTGLDMDGEEPAYMKAIEKVREEAVEKNAIRAGVSEDQISFFAEAEEESAAPLETAEELPAAVPVREEAPVEETAEQEAEEAVPAAEEDTVIPAAPAPEAEEEKVEAEAEIPEEEPLFRTVPEEEEPPAVLQNYVQDYAEPKKEAMVGWLTLFMLFAIPIGLAACVAMLACALAFLALAAAVAVAGVFAIRSLCLGFAVFAAMLLVGGAAIALLALALLFLWTAIWFLAGAIPGIIRGLAELGRNWCYKEVAE